MYRHRQHQLGTIAFLLAILMLPAHRVLAATSITIAVAQQPSSALMHIALNQDFFAEEGLNITIKTYPSGKRALIDGLFKGEADYATSAEVPVVFNAFSRNDFRIIAAINYLDNINRVIARRDAGILNAEDLRVKRVATQKSSAVHYFLYLFLVKHGMLEEDVALSYMKAEQLPEALAKGDIDAFSMREPYISKARSLLQGKVSIFAEPGLFPQFDVLVASERMVNNRHVTQSILKALIKAERFALEHPRQAITAVSAMTGVAREDIERLWPDFNLKVRLGQSLLLALESEVNWVLDSKLIAHDDIPDMLQLIEAAPLKALSPDSVSFIH